MEERGEWGGLRDERQEDCNSVRPEEPKDLGDEPLVIKSNAIAVVLVQV